MIAGWAVGLTLWVLTVLVFATILARIVEHRIEDRERREIDEHTHNGEYR